MKKYLAACLSLVCAGFAFAGGIENKTNMSTGYLRNPSRNTEHKRPEAAFYNIAGTAFMDDGLYIEAGNQFIIKEYKNSIPNSPFPGFPAGSYNDETFVYLYPNADIVYKHDRWAVFANFGIYAGGGKLEYSEGTSATALAFASSALNYKTQAETIAATNPTDPRVPIYSTSATNLLKAAMDHSLTVTSITYGWQAGGAFAVTDWLSIGAAFRLTYGTQKLELTSSHFTLVGNGGNEISYNASAVGFSGVFGIHAKPIDGLDLAGQFAWRSKMNYELSDKKGNLINQFITGNEFRTDLAPVLNLGVGYRIIDPLYVSTSFNYYFNNLAEMNSVLGKTDYNNSFEIALGTDYDIAKAVTASLGVAYGHQGITDTSNSVFNPVLDSFQVGAGVEVRPIELLTITGGATWVNYFSHDYYISGAGKSIKTELSKPLLVMFSIGATFHLPL